MANRTGTVDIVQNQNSNAVDVTVPAAAEGAILFWEGYVSGGSGLTAVTLGGTAMTIESQSNDGTTGHVGVASLRNPTTGALQSLNWTWGASQEFGGQLALVYVENILDEVGWIRDSGSVLEGTAGGDPGPLTVNSASDDLVIGIVCSWPAPDPDGAVTGQTVFQEASTFSSKSFELIEVDSPGSSTTDVNMTGFSFSHMAAISIQDAGGGASTLPGSPVGRKSLLRGLTG